MQPVCFPFVVGCNRSGTTMLRGMLDSHSELAVPPEAYFVVPLLNSQSFVREGRFDAAALLDDVRGRGSFRDGWLLPDSAVESLARTWRPSDAAEALTELYACYAREHGKARYADKTPQHVVHIELLARSFAQARFVHLIRDGRNVVSSLLDYPHGPTRFVDGVEYWRYRVSAGRRAGARLGPDRYLEIRYEALVDDPEAALREICAFIELPYEPEMLAYHSRAGQLLTGIADPNQHKNISRPPTRDIRDWRTTMPARETELFDLLAGDLLDELGYERSGRAPSVSARAEAALARTISRARARAGAVTRRVKQFGS